MKIVISTSLLLFGITSASLESLHANVANMANSRNSTGGRGELRAFQAFVKDMFSAINGYGCWCYLDSSWRDENQVLINRPAILAHGMAVDPIDESCRDLINSYKCIEMDAEEEGDYACNAQAVEYKPFNFFSANTDVESECTEFNQDKGSCAVNACIVEGVFTLNYIDYMFAGIAQAHPHYNADHLHANNGGTFDPSVSCPGIPNPVGSDKQCCGEYDLLTRHPYRLYTGFTTRSCCNGEVINNEIQQCCNNLTPMDINELC